MVCKIGFSIGVREELLSIKVGAHYCLYQFGCLNVEKKFMKNNGPMHIVSCLHFLGITVIWQSGTSPIFDF